MSLFGMFDRDPLRKLAQRAVKALSVDRIDGAYFSPILLTFDADGGPDGGLERFHLQAPSNEEAQDSGYRMVREMAATAPERLSAYVLVHPGHYYFGRYSASSASYVPVALECGEQGGADAAVFVKLLTRRRDGSLHRGPGMKRLGDTDNALQVAKNFASRTAATGAVRDVAAFDALARLPQVIVGLTVLEAGASLDDIGDDRWADVLATLDAWREHPSPILGRLASSGTIYVKGGWSRLEEHQHGLGVDMFRSALHVSHQVLIEFCRLGVHPVEDLSEALTELHGLAARTAAGLPQGADGLERLLGHLQAIAADPMAHAALGRD